MMASGRGSLNAISADAWWDGRPSGGEGIEFVSDGGRISVIFGGRHNRAFANASLENDFADYRHCGGFSAQDEARHGRSFQ
jgi:hypothetical protein